MNSAVIILRRQAQVRRARILVVYILLPIRAAPCARLHVLIPPALGAISQAITVGVRTELSLNARKTLATTKEIGRIVTCACVRITTRMGVTEIVVPMRHCMPVMSLPIPACRS